MRPPPTYSYCKYISQSQVDSFYIIRERHWGRERLSKDILLFIKILVCGGDVVKTNHRDKVQIKNRDKSCWWEMTNAAYWQVRGDTVTVCTDCTRTPPGCDVAPTSLHMIWSDYQDLTQTLSVPPATPQHASVSPSSPLLAPPLLLRQLPANLRPGQSRSVWTAHCSPTAGHTSEQQRSG